MASVSESAAAFQIALPAEWQNTPPDAVAQPTQIGRDLSNLVRWAQHGGGDEERAYDLFLSLFPRLYGRPLESWVMPPLDELDIEPVDEISVVVVAAIARFNMRTGTDVDIRGLAALASISHHRIRHLATQGDVKRSKRGRVSAEEARRFLEARRVPV
jgi:hypothetical protein